MIGEYLEPHRGVLEVFEKSGFKAYFVGGCVRDAFLGRTAKDIDITTDAKPEEIEKLFGNHYDIGAKFGSLTVDYNGNYYDVTTMRTESAYKNFRHPEKLDYTDDIKLDLKRRDFTVNAMAYNFDEGCIDLFGGISDLNNKSIRVVGKANRRFHEDALRMMRAVRFSCELGFTIDSATLRAVRKDARRIRHISRERIYSEFYRAVTGSFPQNLIYLKNTGLGIKIHPAFRTLNYNDIPTQKDYILRLSHILGEKDTAVAVLEYLKAEKSIVHNVIRVLDGISGIHDESEYSIRRLISSAGFANAKRVLILKGYDVDSYSKILHEKDCTSLAELAVNGHDLINEGIAEEGIEIRHILNNLLDEVLKDPTQNSYEILIKSARRMKS